jgi:hypothetical protein
MSARRSYGSASTAIPNCTRNSSGSLRREADRIAHQRLRQRPQQPKPTKVYPVCGTTFTPQRSDAVICSPKCRKKQSRAAKAGS